MSKKAKANENLLWIEEQVRTLRRNMSKYASDKVLESSEKIRKKVSEEMQYVEGFPVHRIAQTKSIVVESVIKR